MSGRKKIFPEGKIENVTVRVNKDFKKEMLLKINESRKPFFILEGESEMEYIKRIQQMNLAKCESEALKSKK